MVYLHAISGKRTEPRFDRGEGMICANFRTFAGEQILGHEHEIVGDLRLINLRKRTKGRGRVAGFLIPVAAGPVRGDERLDMLNRLDAREIVNVRLASQAAEVCLLAGISFHRFLERLVGGDPEILAERVVGAIDADRARWPDEAAEAVLADEVRAVELVIADTRRDVHHAVASVRGGDQRAVFGNYLANIHVQ